MYSKEKYELVFALGNELKRMYDTAKEGEQVTMIHLFGIKYGESIKENGLKIADIVRAAQINESYKTEVSKGVNLSKYVDIKNGLSL